MPGLAGDEPVGMAAVRDRALDVKAAIKADNVVVNAAGLAFFGLLALVPTLLAVVSLYGLVRDPDEVQEQIGDLLEGSPEEIRDFVTTQLEALAGSSSGSLGVTIVISILIALWSASGAINHLLKTLNDIHGFDESRGFVTLRGISYLFTLGAIAVLAATIFLLGILPGLLASTGLGTAGRFTAGILRFPVLLVLMVVSLSVLYHLGPDRPYRRRFRFFSAGAVIATLAWLVGSALFSIYTANIGRLNETYAATGGLVILLLFLLLTSFCVLLGAEIEDATERRQRADRLAVAAPAAPAHPATQAAGIGAALVGFAVGVVLGRRG